MTMETMTPSGRLRRAWHVFWGQRTAREQRWLRALAGGVVLLLLWLCVEALLRERSRLQRTLPVLEQRVLAQQMMVREWDELKARPVSRRSPAEAALVLQESAKLHGLTLQAGAAEGQWMISGFVKGDEWIIWLGELQSQQRLIPDRVVIQQVSAGVEIQVSLVWVP